MYFFSTIRFMKFTHTALFLPEVDHIIVVIASKWAKPHCLDLVRCWTSKTYHGWIRSWKNSWKEKHWPICRRRCIWWYVDLLLTNSCVCSVVKYHDCLLITFKLLNFTLFVESLILSYLCSILFVPCFIMNMGWKPSVLEL